MVSMRVQFERVKRIARKNHIESRKLDLMIEKKWGFSYSDKDIDEIIDSLDYGQGELSFERFSELMNNPDIRFAFSKRLVGDAKSENSEVEDGK